MDICIIGGGLTGLSAAYHLKEKANINIYEKSGKLGGCLSSSKAGNGFAEDFYHHCFSGDKNLLRLFGKLDLLKDLEWLSGSTGYYADGKIYPLTTPVEILKYPYLSFMDKFRLGMLTIRSKKYDREILDNIPAKDFIEEKCGKKVYESFFEPLLNSKFGDMKGEVSAAWLVSRIAIRSDRTLEGEKLGYLKNGYISLINSLEDELLKSDCSILTGEPARSIIRKDEKWEVNGKLYDIVISTTSPERLKKISTHEISGIEYQGAACMMIGLSKEVTNGIYWLNMKDNAPYGAVIGHTNFVPKERYGEHIVYLASYFKDKPPENLDKKMLDDFCKRFGVCDSDINWHRMKIEKGAGPVYTTGYNKQIPEYETDTKFFVAGMFSRPNYPERSMEGSIIAGKEVAEIIETKYLRQEI
ncbi:NAD(P)/FAD-dependent oxidoreductase [Methanoplanus sp. FWC-SCC4]|uniref:NAD(P)/FAD-dependent oxidoreductase n=1 Tax=Methanochimaera problematica TaxID=2609417 RepID=A0AA97I3H8_9EURY|nr:NAD(P)/FAD-dependent oxidoreductase [Methanoplanus sp. FWC-SCC4]WOF15584.1 NAD(P)/FAD-dependent oxidoreductase [Methanoplanus sp. FWC-SCC4]